MINMRVNLEANEFTLAIPQYTHLLKNNVWHEYHQFLFFKKTYIDYMHNQYTYTIYTIHILNI